MLNKEQNKIPIPVGYDKELEVNSNQYSAIMKQLSGTCAGREAAGKFFIKLWEIRHKKEVLKALNALKGTDKKDFIYA